MPKKYKAKFACKCRKCKFDIFPGEDVLWFGKGPDGRSIYEHAGPCPKEPPKPPAGFKKTPFTPRPAVPVKNQWDTYAELVLTQILKGHPDQFPGPQASAALAADYADKMMAARAKRGIK
ncbi:MAG TPA: hypothetical protein VHE12_05685 [bacterium]|nr:hypothetical protein [bacterium]